MKISSSNRLTAVGRTSVVAAATAGVLPAGLLALAALTTVTLARVGGLDRAADPVLALVDPSPDGTAAAVRAMLLVATAATAGIGLVAGALSRFGDRRVGRGVLVLAWVAGLLASAGCALEVLAGGASRPLAAGQAAVSLLVPLLLGTARPGTAAPVALVLAGVLGVELGTARTGLPLVVDVVFALAGAVLFGACVLGVGAGAGHQAGVGGGAGVGAGHGAGRVRGVAIAAGLVTTVAGVGQLALTGPPAGYDMLHTGYGLAALVQAAVPLLVTATWLVTEARPGRAADRPESAIDVESEVGSESDVEVDQSEDRPEHLVAGPRAGGRGRAGELSRLCAGGVTVAFAAAAVLATLPHPAGAPVPGQPLARPVELPFQHLAVLLAPMRPGPNLVHVAATPAGAGSQLAGQHHGAPPPSTPPGTITVSAGGVAVPVTTRPGAPGGWAVLDIPVGVDQITVTADGSPATVPVDVGDTPGDPALQRALTGPDGPECASGLLGGLVAVSTVGRTPAEANLAADCPSQALTAADSDALRDTVTFLAGRGITGLNLVSDGSARGVAAADLVRAQAARAKLPVRPVGAPTDTLLVVSGWSAAVPALTDAVARSEDSPAGGIVLAPWLLASGVVAAAPSEVLPLTFNPGESPARQYGATVAAVFPGEGPSAAGYLAWLRAGGAGAPLEPRATFYGAAPVDVPMGMDDMHMGGNPGAWYPSGTIVPISPPVGPAGAKQ
ncbi:MAG TPA: hypothetical protein VK735_33115 [Pseudonocardia sp.]|uniref:hypothetical protein n=1 Tax=Pseudonocardia sp. TaxID=60912 RepID=UPI002C39C9DC|nr:hypothetical protein [Pseudonocardia sp.]HTF52311.1 hypothetical protein [Pseudonocardia sp.]